MPSLLAIVSYTASLSFVSSTLTPALAAAQPRDTSLHITIVDPLGAVIVGATIELAGDGTAALIGSTDAVGVATFDVLLPGRWSLRVSSPGFETLSEQVVLRRGVNRLERQLQIEHFVDEIVVTRDPREAATDPAGDTLTVTLGSDALEALPDAPEELEQVLQELAGPGAEVNVDGFQGSAPPSKNRIQEIRVRCAMYSAESHNRSSARVEIVTKPGTERWQSNISFGFRTDALNARNAFAASETPEQHNRLSAMVQGPLVRNRTSLSAEIEGLWSVRVAHDPGFEPDWAHPGSRAAAAGSIEHRDARSACTDQNAHGPRRVSRTTRHAAESGGGRLRPAGARVFTHSRRGGAFVWAAPRSTSAVSTSFDGSSSGTAKTTPRLPRPRRFESWMR